MPRHVSCPDFVGRIAELAVLQGALSRAAAAEPSVVLVGGGAGAGKTRLIREFGAQARADGARVLVGSCLPLAEGLLPYGPVVDIVRDAGAAAPYADSSGILARLAEPVAAGAADERPREFERGRMLAALQSLCVALSETAPTVVVFEDLHWADASTREVLAYLARAVLDCRLVLIGTYRDDELPGQHPLWTFLAQVQRAGADHVDLRPFDRREVTAQIRGILGSEPDSSLVDEILARSEGNPFFVEELLASGTDDQPLPGGLRNLVLERVRRLPEPAQHVVDVAAVAGRRVDHRLLTLVAAMPEEDLLGAIRAAVDRHVLVPVAATDAYAFRHALVREAVYGELLAGERIGLHREFAEQLSRNPQLAAAGGASAAAELAFHWTAAREEQMALAASVEAGLAAEQTFAYSEAHRHFERAIDFWSGGGAVLDGAGLDAVDLCRHAAEMAYLSGSFDRAVELCERAIDHNDAVADPRRVGLLYERLGRYLTASGNAEARVLAAYGEAVRLVPAAVTRERARVLATMGQALMLATRYEESSRFTQRAIEIADALGEGGRSEKCHALCTLGVLLGRAGDMQRSLDALNEALTTARNLGAVDDIHRVYANLSDTLAAGGRYAESARVALDGVAVAKQFGVSATIGVFLLGNAVSALTFAGRWDEAEAHLRKAQPVAPGGMMSANFHASAAELRTAQGRFEEADEHIAAAMETMPGGAYAELTAELRARVADAAAWRHRFDVVAQAVSDGLAALESGEENDIAARLVSIGLRAVADAVEPGLASRNVGEDLRADQLSRLGEAVEQIARRGPVTPEAAGYLLVCQAEMSRAKAGRDPGPWEAVSAHWQALGCLHLAAYGHWRAGAALLAAGGRRVDALAEIAEAHHIAAGLGAWPLIGEIEALAVRARFKLPAPRPEQAPEDPHGLTDRERDVLALLATGSTNRQIASALFISEKTVSVHVSHILAKLGVANRGEAAAVAYRLGITRVPE